MIRTLIASFLLYLCSTDLSAIELHGTAAQGGMMVGVIKVEAHTDTKILLDGAPIPILPSGQFVIGFGRTQRAQALFELIQSNGQTQRQILNIRQRQYDIQHIDGLDDDKVTPPPKAWPQIRRESQQKRAARTKLFSLAGFAQKFVWPISGQISGIYGSQRVLNGQPRRPHYGLDISAQANTKIIAPADGIVTLTGKGFYFEGGLVFLDHGLGLSSAFLHLDKINVRVGQAVRQGDLIGFVGSTGRSTGAHLDWRIKWQRRNLDPALIVTGGTICKTGAVVVRAAATCGEAKANDPASP